MSLCFTCQHTLNSMTFTSPPAACLPCPACLPAGLLPGHSMSMSKPGFGARLEVCVHQVDAGDGAFVLDGVSLSKGSAHHWPSLRTRLRLSTPQWSSSTFDGINSGRCSASGAVVLIRPTDWSAWDHHVQLCTCIAPRSCLHSLTSQHAVVLKGSFLVLAVNKFDLLPKHDQTLFHPLCFNTSLL